MKKLVAIEVKSFRLWAGLFSLTLKRTEPKVNAPDNIGLRLPLKILDSLRCVESCSCSVQLKL